MQEVGLSERMRVNAQQLPKLPLQDLARLSAIQHRTGADAPQGARALAGHVPPGPPKRSQNDPENDGVSSVRRSGAASSSRATAEVAVITEQSVPTPRRTPLETVKNLAEEHIAECSVSKFIEF